MWILVVYLGIGLALMLLMLGVTVAFGSLDGRGFLGGVAVILVGMLLLVGLATYGMPAALAATP